MQGDKLKQIRKAKRLSQQNLAELSGFSRNSIINWETGKRAPRIVDLEKLAKVLNVSLKDFMEDGDSPALATSSAPEPQIESNARLADDEMEWVPVVTNEVKVCCGAGNIYPDEVIWEEVGKYPIPTSVLLGYSWQVGPGGFHIITAEGDSMEPRIPSGSRILVADIRPNSGDLAVSLYKGRMILRGVSFDRGKIRLQAWNKEYQDIIVHDEELEDLCFLGKMLGIVPAFDHLSSMW